MGPHAALAGATQFALPSTYWKDSGVFGEDGRRRSLAYPVAMLLPHAQALCALRCAGDLLGNATLTALATRMGQVNGALPCVCVACLWTWACS